MAAKVTKAVEVEIGKIARPKNVWIVPDMPKTRSGKIMRRVIASISNFADVGDVTTLANPEIVDDIRHHVQSAKVAHGDAPRELAAEEEEWIKASGRPSSPGPIGRGLRGPRRRRAHAVMTHFGPVQGIRSRAAPGGPQLTSLGPGSPGRRARRRGREVTAG